MAELNAERYHHALAEHAAALAALVADADLTLAVPSCPGWDLRRLVEHVGQAHRFAAGIVERRSTERPRGGTRVPMPDDEAGRRAWLPEGVARLSAALRDAGDAPVYNFTGLPKQGFWLRRMAHETAVHHADAAAALGRPFQLDADLAADAITEWLELVTSPGAAAAWPELAEALRGDGQTLHLHGSDEPGLGAAGEWLIRREPDGMRWEHGHARSDVAVRGPAVALLLVMMGRVAPSDDRVRVFGDVALLEHWLRTVSH